LAEDQPDLDLVVEQPDVIGFDDVVVWAADGAGCLAEEGQWP